MGCHRTPEFNYIFYYEKALFTKGHTNIQIKYFIVKEYRVSLLVMKYRLSVFT